MSLIQTLENPVMSTGEINLCRLMFNFPVISLRFWNVYLNYQEKSYQDPLLSLYSATTSTGANQSMYKFKLQTNLSLFVIEPTMFEQHECLYFLPFFI